VIKLLSSVRHIVDKLEEIIMDIPHEFIYYQDKFLSDRAKNIFKFVMESNGRRTFQQIVDGSTGSRSTVRLAVCELVDTGYLRVVRGFDNEEQKNQVYYCLETSYYFD
jgi:hypothetical protein